MPAFLFENPLASVLGILLGLALIACGWQTVRLSSVQADTAKVEKAFADFKEDLAAKSLAVTQAAAKKSEEQFNALQASIGAIGQLGTQTKTEIHYVKSNGGPCVDDPAWRATVGGVQRILDGSSGGDKGQTGGASPAALPGAGAPGSK